MRLPSFFLSGLLVLCGLASAAPEPTIEDLVRRLGDPAYKVREAACEAILALGTEDADRVMAALPGEEADPETRAACVRLRREIPAAHARARIQALGRRDPALAAAIDELMACPSLPSAKGLLAAVGERREIAGEVLVSFTDFPDWGARTEMLRVLTDLGVPSLAPKVVRFLAHEDPEVRLSALGVLAEFRNPAVAGEVARLFGDPESVVRQAAAETFWRLSAGGKGTDLARLFTDPEPGVRATALAAAGRFGDASLAGSIAATLVDPDAHVRAAAIRALAALDARTFSGAIVRCLEGWVPEGGEEPCVPAAAIEALGRFRDPAAAPAVARFLEAPEGDPLCQWDELFMNEPPLRAQAAAALCRMGDRKLLPRFLALLADPNPAARRAVAEALPELADPACLEPLVELCADEDPETAAAAIAALGRLADAIPPRSPPAAR